MRIDKLSLDVASTDSWMSLAKLVSREQQKMTRNGEELAGAAKAGDVFANTQGLTDAALPQG